MSKVSNARKRFRQGRIPFKKLQGIVSDARQAWVEEMKARVASVEDRSAETFTVEEVEQDLHEHIHGESCDHDHH